MAKVHLSPLLLDHQIDTTQVLLNDLLILWDVW